MAGPLLVAALMGGLSWRAYSGNSGALAIALVWSALMPAAAAWAASRERLGAFRRRLFAGMAAAFLLQMHLPRSGPNLEPYCHLGLAGNALQAAYGQYLAVAGGTWGAYGALSLGMAWLLVSLAAGGAFCSWVCFFGGVDDAVSSLRKPAFRIPAALRIRSFQLALLLLVAWASFAHFEPEFCRMLCPFKITGGIAGTHVHPGASMLLSFALVGGILVVALPFLAGQRTFCSGVCPFGAIPPLLSKLTPWRAAIRAEECTGCGKCSSTCPSFAVETTAEGKPRINRFCTSCLRCVEACPAGAIRPAHAGRRGSGLFPWVPLALGGALSVFYVPAGVLAVLRLIAGAPS